MEIFWQEPTSGLPDTQQLARVVIRMIAAVLPGSIIGFEREKAGKAAGLETHILFIQLSERAESACQTAKNQGDGVCITWTKKHSAEIGC